MVERRNDSPAMDAPLRLDADRAAGQGAAPDRLDVLITLLIGVGATLFHCLYFNHGVRNWIDLGVAVVDAERILDGQVFGRDFTAPYGPGRYYLAASWFRLFGASLFTLNCLFLCLMTVVDMLTYLVARRFMLRPLAAGAAILAIVGHGPIHKVYIGLFSILFLWTALRAVERKTVRSGLAMGLAAAAACLFRYDVGAMAICCSGVLIVFIAFLPPIADRKKGLGRIKPLASGFILGCGVPLLLLAGMLAIWADPHWLVEQISCRIRAFDSIHVDEPGIFELLAAPEAGARFRAILTLLLVATPFAATLLGVVDLRAGRGSAAWIAIPMMGLLGVLLLNQWRLIPRFNRLLQAGPVLYVQVVLLIAVLARFFRGRRYLAGELAACGACGVLIAVISLYLFLYTGTGSQDSFAVLRQDECYLDLEKAKCHVPRNRCLDIAAAVREVEARTAPGEPIATGPGCPVVSFLADRPNAAPFTDPFLYFLNREAEKRVVREVRESRAALYVDWRIRREAPLSIFGLSLANAAPEFHFYLNETYRPVWQKPRGRFTIWQRRLTP